MTFNIGDRIRRKNGRPFSSGPTAVVCECLPRQSHMDSPLRVWIETERGPKYAMISEVELVGLEAQIESWLDDYEGKGKSEEPTPVWTNQYANNTRRSTIVPPSVAQWLTGTE